MQRESKLSGDWSISTRSDPVSSPGPEPFRYPRSAMGDRALEAYFRSMPWQAQPMESTSGPSPDSESFEWHRRPGLLLAIRYLRSHHVQVVETPLSELPKLSKRAIRLALRLFPKFLDRADLTFPVIIAGRGWSQIALDGRHRISKAIWTGHPSLPAVHVSGWYALELLFPGVYEVEWLALFLRKELRRSGRNRS